MKSILMIGQSNMAGRGFINEVPMICNERILMLRNAGWQMMAEPINYDRPNAGIGLAGSFAAMWCMEHEGEQIGLIPCEGSDSAVYLSEYPETPDLPLSLLFLIRKNEWQSKLRSRLQR